jgi:hypothetical protein
MAIQRICIFCGAPPENKNKEHPLPRWLLEMTGDPNRVVAHGYRWKDGKVFEFSFDSLVFPACSSCNSRYSGFESHSRTIVEAICQKQAVAPDDYVHLLDWLDKVRIGLWLGYRYLQQNPFPPNFTIDSRLGKKDRMVAVYAIGDHQTGLNTWGPESRLFQYKPSVFALRVNNILFLNASWDFMCSRPCGYSYPSQVTFAREHPGMMAMSDYRSRRRITHPIMSGLMKSCVTIFQPIIQHNADYSVTSLNQADVEYHMRHAWPGRNGLGPLVRQFSKKSIRVNPNDPGLEFDAVTLSEANRTQDIATQAYSFQNESIRLDPRSYDDGTRYEGAEVAELFARENVAVMQAIRSMSPEQNKKEREKLEARRKEKE